MKRWPLGTRLAIWTAFFLTFELIIFGLASGTVIFNEQLEAFREIKGDPTSPVVIRKEATELIFDLAVAYLTALPAAALTAAFGVWWITRKSLKPLRDVADAAEKFMRKHSVRDCHNLRLRMKSAGWSWSSTIPSIGSNAASRKRRAFRAMLPMN